MLTLKKLSVEYVTHASILINSGKLKFLTDPFFFLDPLLKQFMCHFPPRDLTPKYFGKLDFVYCSHIHDDHSHKPTLTKLKNQIKTMVLPNMPDLIEKIRGFGFKKIIVLENEQTMELSPDLKVTCYFDQNNGFDTALVIETGGKTILHQNDCRLDAPTFERMAGRHKVDVAFFPHTSFQDLYPMLLPYPKEKLLELSTERESAEISYLIDCLKILKPRVVVPYSYTIVYFNKDQFFKNGFGRTTPPLFKKELLAKTQNIKCLVMQPGDVFMPGDDSLKPVRDENLWGDNLEDYLKNIQRYALSNQKKCPVPDFGEPKLIEKLVQKFFAKRILKPFPEDFARQTIALHVTGNKHKKTYYIDTDQKSFGPTTDKMPFLEIFIPTNVLKELMRGTYDPFMILYSYRIEFKLNIFLGLNPRNECVFYTLAIIALFNPALHEQLMSYIVERGQLAGSIF